MDSNQNEAAIIDAMPEADKMAMILTDPANTKDIRLYHPYLLDPSVPYYDNITMGCDGKTEVDVLPANITFICMEFKEARMTKYAKLVPDVKFVIEIVKPISEIMSQLSRFNIVKMAIRNFKGELNPSDLPRSLELLDWNDDDIKVSKDGIWPQIKDFFLPNFTGPLLPHMVPLSTNVLALGKYQHPLANLTFINVDELRIGHNVISIRNTTVRKPLINYCSCRRVVTHYINMNAAAAVYIAAAGIHIVAACYSIPRLW